MVGDDLNSENTYKKIGLTISLLLHAILFAVILLWPSLRYDFPPPGKEGILVIFGDSPESADDELDSNSSSENNEDQKENTENEKKTEKKIEKQKKPDQDKKSKIEKDLEEDNDKIVLDSKKKDNRELTKEIVPEKTI